MGVRVEVLFKCLITTTNQWKFEIEAPGKKAVTERQRKKGKTEKSHYQNFYTIACGTFMASLCLLSFSIFQQTHNSFFSFQMQWNKDCRHHGAKKNENRGK